jgi:hypothetical protein
VLVEPPGRPNQAGAGQSGQAQLGDGDVDAAAGDRLERLLTGSRPDDLVAVELEHPAQKVPSLGVLLGDEDLSHGSLLINAMQTVMSGDMADSLASAFCDRIAIRLSIL